MNPDEEYNISMDFFDQIHGIFDKKGKPFTNIYISYANRQEPVFGTVYLMHGYGGSPAEFCMQEPAKKALLNGFDVVAIESVALSATFKSDNNITEMNLARHKKAIKYGLRHCEKNEKLCNNYKIVWSHSLSGRALADLIFSSEFVRKYFNEFIFLNPYFLPPSKLENIKKSFMARDDSGKMWSQLTHKIKIATRTINGLEYKIPTNAYHFTVPVPSKYKAFEKDFKSLTGLIESNMKNKSIQFILGTDDDKAEFRKNEAIFKELKIENKYMYIIDGANHFFDNKPEQYINCTENIINNIKHNMFGNIR